MRVPAKSALIKNELWGSLVPRLVVILIVCVGGCETLDSRVYHTLGVFNTGKSEVINVTYTYGELGARFKRRLGLVGTSITSNMKIPETIDVKWVTESDGVSHHVQVPLRENVSLGMLREKEVSIEIDRDKLRVFIVQSYRPNRQPERTQIFGDDVER